MHSLRGRVYTHCGAICCSMGLPRASPVNPPKQAQAAKDGATMCVYPAPEAFDSEQSEPSIRRDGPPGIRHQVLFLTGTWCMVH